MKIETEARDDHQVKVTAEFESHQLEKYRQQAVRKISREAKIPGFRPGKAPLPIIRRMFGDQAIQEQAVELMIDAVYPDILKEANLTPPFPGSLDEIISVDPPKFSFIIPLLPEVDLGNYRDIRQEFAAVEVSETEVDEFLHRMQVRQTMPEPVTRPAEKGDLIFLTVSGTLNEPDEDGKTDFIRNTPYQVVIDDSTLSPDDWPYQGFSHELIGLSTGDEKDIPYTYPEDFEIEKVRGKGIVFHVTVSDVKSIQLPAVDEDFAKSMGGHETVEDLRKSIREVITSNKNDQYERDYFNRLMDQIIEQASIKYPPQMLDEEIHQVMHNVEDNLAQQKMDLETYLKMMGLDKDGFIEKEAHPTAVRRLERALVLDKIIHEEDIQLRENELQRAFGETLNDLQQSNELQEMQRHLKPQLLADTIMREAANRALNKRVLRRLKAIATGQEDIEQEEEDVELDAESAAAEMMAVEETESEITAGAEDLITPSNAAEVSETPEA